MAVLAQERPPATPIEAVPAADPAPLGLAVFALTTFMLSGHNANFIPDRVKRRGMRPQVSC
jgi:succinate-acetate transporter protein